MDYSGDFVDSPERVEKIEHAAYQFRCYANGTGTGGDPPEVIGPDLFDLRWVNNPRRSPTGV